MEIAEAVNAKIKLQKDIYELIRSFSKETGLAVTDIVVLTDQIDFGKTMIASLEVKVSL